MEKLIKTLKPGDKVIYVEVRDNKIVAKEETTIKTMTTNVESWNSLTTVELENGKTIYEVNILKNEHIVLNVFLDNYAFITRSVKPADWTLAKIELQQYIDNKQKENMQSISDLAYKNEELETFKNDIGTW